MTCRVGRDIQDIYDYRPREHGEVALKVDGLQGPGLRAPISFEVRKGEILGLFGLVGAGRTELFRLLSGLERASAGQLELCGESLHLRSPRDAIAAGVLLCPEDRKKEGIIPLSSVAENINISARGARADTLNLLREAALPQAGVLHCFTEDWNMAKAALDMGLCFISEGAIPFAAKDPLRVIPASILGGALTGGEC